MEIRLVILFLSRKKIHAKQIFVSSSSMKLGPDCFDNSGFSEDELMADMVDHLVDDLAARYALDSSRGSILVSVDGIDDLDDYAQVSQYLESLGPVLNSTVVEVSGRELRLRLVTEGQSQQLIEIIQLDDKMLLVNDGSRMRGDGALHYRWLL